MSKKKFRSCQNALEPTSPSPFSEKLASAYIATHKQDRAMEVLEEAISQEPDAKLCFIKGQLLYSQRRFDHAYQAFENGEKLEIRLPFSICLPTAKAKILKDRWIPTKR